MKITEIYGKEEGIKKGKIDRKNGLFHFTLNKRGRIVADVFYLNSFSNPVIIIPGAGCNDEKKRVIISKFKFLIRENFSLIFYNYPDLNVFSFSDNDFFNYIKRCVEEIRGVIKTIENSSSFSIIGMSLGGIIGLITTGVEEKIEKSVIFISGGNFEIITWKGFLRFKLKKDCSRIACKNMHKVYKKLLDKKMYDEILKLPRKCFLYDPLTFKEFLKNKKILMINGLFDFIIPPLSAIEMKKGMKNIRHIWCPSTHLSFPLFFPFFKKKIFRFLTNETKD